MVSACLVTYSCGTGRNAVSRGKMTAQSQNTGKPTQSKEERHDVSRQAFGGNDLVAEAYTWLGTRYQYGGHSKKGTDCSGMIMEIFLKVMNIKLPRASWEQQEYCRSVNLNNISPGDLVFFSTAKNRKVSHVGMYIGNGEIIHASPSRGVIISNLGENYFQRNYHSSGSVGTSGGMATVNRKNTKQQSEPEISLPQAKTPTTSISVRLEDLENVLDMKSDSIMSQFMD